jgi:hypothetical protein
MATSQTAPKDIDEYIARFPDDVRQTLEKIRMTIRKAAPNAQETISYQIPTFTLNGNWCILPLLKNTSACILAQVESRSLRMSYLLITARKIRCSFHWISQFLLA